MKAITTLLLLAGLAGCTIEFVDQDPAPDDVPACGNGLVEGNESCDDGNLVDSDGCSADCLVESHPIACGDGWISGPEQCDDGNQVAGDGCSADCLSTEVCGNHVVDVVRGEQCDDGNLVPGDGCDATCHLSGTCGDGAVDAGEQCDDAAETATCDLDCTLASCGDGQVNGHAGEQCDVGSQGPSCDADCTLPVCGDALVNPTAGEECDDGNHVSGDGCSALCRVE